MAQAQQRARSMRVPDIRKGDQVLVLSGKEAGKKGTVEHVVRNRQGFKKVVSKYGSNWRKISPLADVAVVVEGLNIAKRHTKPRPKQGRTDRQPRIQQGGILDVRSRSWPARSWSSARTAASRRASSTAWPVTAAPFGCAPTAARRSCARCASDRDQARMRLRQRPPKQPRTEHAGHRGNAGREPTDGLTGGGGAKAAKAPAQTAAPRRGHQTGDWTGLRARYSRRSRARHSRRSSATPTRCRCRAWPRSSSTSAWARR